MIDDVLPPGTSAAEAFGDDLVADLLPEERKVITAAVAARRREFAGVRACARTALARMGQRPGPILPGPHGAAVWPPGIVGSMTHCPGYCAAVVAFARDVTSIGIDAEPDEPLPEGVAERIASADERERLAALALARPAISWDRLLLCTKEAVYKAWHPLVHRWIDFLEADVTLDPQNGTFVARLLSGGPVVEGGTIARFDGRWVASGGLLVTAVVLSRPFSASHPGPSSYRPRCAS